MEEAIDCCNQIFFFLSNFMVAKSLFWFECEMSVLWVGGFYWVMMMIKINQLIGLVFANGPGDLGSIPGQVIPETIKIILDIYLLNTQQYTVRIKGRVD